MDKRTLILAALIATSTLAAKTDELETAYWDCDYAATQGALGFGDATTCSQVFEALKKEKFGGDFKKFMEWWKDNKEVEHSKRLAKDRSRT